MSYLDVQQRRASAIPRAPMSLYLVAAPLQQLNSDACRLAYLARGLRARGKRRALGDGGARADASSGGGGCMGVQVAASVIAFRHLFRARFCSQSRRRPATSTTCPRPAASMLLHLHRAGRRLLYSSRACACAARARARASAYISPRLRSSGRRRTALVSIMRDLFGLLPPRAAAPRDVPRRALARRAALLLIDKKKEGRVLAYLRAPRDLAPACLRGSAARRGAPRMYPPSRILLVFARGAPSTPARAYSASSCISAYTIALLPCAFVIFSASTLMPLPSRLPGNVAPTAHRLGDLCKDL